MAGHRKTEKEGVVIFDLEMVESESWAEVSAGAVRAESSVSAVRAEPSEGVETSTGSVTNDDVVTDTNVVNSSVTGDTVMSEEGTAASADDDVDVGSQDHSMRGMSHACGLHMR